MMQSDCSTSRHLRALFLPPSPWVPRVQRFVPGEGPNPNELFDALARESISTVSMDPYSWPINPLAGRHSLLESLDLARALKVLWDGRQFDVIVSVMEGASLFPLALRNITAMRTPIVLWDIGLSEGWRLRDRVLDFVVPRAEAIFVLSASQKIYVQRRWRPTGVVEVVSHQVDTTFYHPLPETLANRVVSIGEDVGRDFHTLLAAASRVNATFVVKTRSHQELIRKSALHNVAVISDWLSFVDLRTQYAESTVIVVPLLPSINASGVSTILEAGAMAKAIVVTDSASIRDFIIPGETCLMVPPGDSDAMANAITSLLASPELRNALGTRAREFVSKEFSSKVLAGRVASAMRRIATA